MAVVVNGLVFNLGIMKRYVSGPGWLAFGLGLVVAAIVIAAAAFAISEIPLPMESAPAGESKI